MNKKILIVGGTGFIGYHLGCKLIKKNWNVFSISTKKPKKIDKRENRNLNFGLNIKQNKYYIFDGRFLVKSSLAGKLVRCNDSDLVSIDNKNAFYEYDYWINNTIPYLKTLEGKTIKPYLKIINHDTKSNNVSNEGFNLYLLNRILI